jgi:hypothetical protein
MINLPDEISSRLRAEVLERERDTWREELRKSFPNWTSRLQWGFEHGDGWRAITQRVFEDLSVIVGTDAPTIAVHQIKAKVGSYSFYVDTDQLSEEQRTAVAQCLAEANSQAKSTCETCGSPGQLIRDRGWYHVACSTHAVRDIR